MTAQWLLNWYNLIFVIPFGLALIYLGLYTLSGWTFGEADVDVDADVEADADIDTDAEIEADADAGADHDADAAHHGGGGGGGGGAGGSAAFAVLSFLGIGRAPLSLLLMMLMMTWGILGFAANTYARESLPRLAQPWLLSIPLAAFGSLLITRFLAGMIGRYLPMSETYARRRHDFLGSVGEVVLPTDRRFGMVAVRDATSGERFQLPCRLEAGDRVIPKGTAVKLVAYNADEKLFYVLENDFGDAQRAGDSPARSAV